MDKYELAALRTANKVRRKAFGLPAVDRLYPGYTRSPGSCPITNTIYDDDIKPKRGKVKTGLTEVTTKDEIRGTETHPLSVDAQAFVSRFDYGWYPHLNKRRKAVRDAQKEQSDGA